jgi:hypothetical protein
VQRAARYVGLDVNDKSKHTGVHIAREEPLLEKLRGKALSKPDKKILDQGIALRECRMSLRSMADG